MKKFFLITALAIVTASAGIWQTSSALAVDKTKIGVATVAPTMGSYPAMVAISDYFNKNAAVNITLSSIAGSTAMPTSVEKMAQTGMGMGFSLPIAMLSSAYHGIVEYEGKPNKSLRMMFVGLWEYTGTYTVKGSDITSISQTKGKRFPYFTRTTNGQYPPLFEAYGVDYNKDLKLIKIPSPGAAAKALSLGKLDLAGGTIAGSKIIEVAEAKGGVIVLPVDPDKLAAIKTKYPVELNGFDSVTLKPGEVPGVSNTEPTPVMDFKLTSFAHKDVPDSVVYSCVKAVLDHPETIKALHRLFDNFSLATAAPVIDVPYHPGAVKALKEKGLWTAAHEKMQQKLSR